MEEDKKKLFEYLREIYKLKTRVVSDYTKYDKNIDIDLFRNTYGDIAYIHDFSDDISGENEYFALKYITDNYELPIPSEKIKDYIDTSEKDIKLKEDASEEIKSLFEEYKIQYDEITKKNNLVKKYNELYEYFYNVYKKINDFEEKIEVVLCKGLLRYENEEITINPIKRHIFEAPLKIEIDHQTNTIFLKVDRDTKCNVESNFMTSLKGFKVKNQNAIYDLKEDIINQYANDEIIDFEKLYNDYLNNLYFKVEYAKKSLTKELEKDRCYIFDKDVIVVRKKQPTIWLDDINAILKHIEENGELKLDNKIIDLILEKDEDKVDALLDSKLDDFQILFPLPSNDEQYKVVEQTKSSNIVLVQGPPGTGKSHTITNMISTYVANGKKVLVTSEKSRALEVVKEKLPEQIKDLSMTLLSDKNNDSELVKSVQCVLEKYKEKDFLDRYRERIKEIEEKLQDVREKYNTNYNEILNILDNNVKDNKEEVKQYCNIDLEQYRLIDIAKYLYNNKTQDIIKDKNNYEQLAFNTEVLYKLEQLADELKKYKKFIFDREFDLPRDIDFDAMAKAIEMINQGQQSNAITEDIKEESIEKYDINLILEDINKIIKIEKLYDKNFIKENCAYAPRIKNIENIIKECRDSKEYFEQVESMTLSSDIVYDKNKMLEYSKALNLVNEKLVNDGKISLIEKFQVRKELELIGEILLNNCNYTFENISADTLKLLINKVNYDVKVRKIVSDVDRVLGKSSLFDNTLYNEFSRKLDELIDVLSTFVQYTEITEKTKSALGEIFKSNVEVEELLKKEDYEGIVTSLRNVLGYEKFIDDTNKFNEMDKKIRNKTLKNKDIFERLLNAFSNKSIDEFNSELNKVKDIYKLTDAVNELKKEYINEFKNYNLFIQDFVSKDSDTRVDIIKNFDLYFEYYKLKMFLFYKELDNSKFDELFSLNKQLQKEEKTLIVKLITEKSWCAQINNMTISTCRALSEWLSLKIKLGKGTGKRANVIRKQMQEKMIEAKEAFPIWIMPAEKVIEQYPFSVSAPFDVIVMDESSQSSILSITALLRGKKCVIVGDDKQISPIEVGINVDDLNALQHEYLKDTRLGVEFEIDTSLYDVAQNVCGNKKVVLKEHFRCLPEIIQFSNENFYGNQINCLKVRGKENTIEKPIKTYFVEDATVKRVAGSNMINLKEVQAIIDILKSISEDKTYINKTIGVIALQNSTAHINAITSEIWKNFDDEFIKKRKIKIGNAYDFQGDERDVIILSMVTSKLQENGEENPVIAFTKKEYDRSFNVAASRAKEQSILVYSIKTDSLSNKCLRYKLLNYYLTYNQDKEVSSELEFDSDFEKDLHKDLSSRGIKLKSKFKIGKYTIDFIVENDNGKKVAIECDGDKYYDTKEFIEELKEQDVLERCGWSYIRVRAGQYYNNPQNFVENLLKKIDSLLEI